MADAPGCTAPSDRPHDDVCVSFLGSGSAGNATAITCRGTTLLVDTGFSARETVRRLRYMDIDERTVAAIILTHEHSDHVCGVRVLASQLGTPVYGTRGTLDSLRMSLDDCRRLVPGEQTGIAGFDVVPFRTSHDAAEPIGMRISAPGGRSIGLATDTGEPTAEMVEGLGGCSLVGIECNHDPDMLIAGPYPWFLKNRVLSSRGHLANERAAGVLSAIAHDGLLNVVALHLSSTNNTTALAHRALSAALDELDHPAVVECTAQQDTLGISCGSVR